MSAGPVEVCSICVSSNLTKVHECREGVVGVGGVGEGGC